MFSINPKINETFYLVFEEGAKTRWYTRFLEPGFRHCYIMKKTEAEMFWLVINPMRSHTDLDYRLVETFPTPQDYAGDHAVIVEYNAVIDPSASAGTLCINTCTDVIKRMIGMRRFWLFTPYQLYKEVSND